MICSTFTFSAHPINCISGLLSFIDSELETWNMCPKSLEFAIKDRISSGVKAGYNCCSFVWNNKDERDN